MSKKLCVRHGRPICAERGVPRTAECLRDGTPQQTRYVTDSLQVAATLPHSSFPYSEVER